MHRVICRGIERTKIFYDNLDHDNFLERLENILFGKLGDVVDGVDLFVLCK